MVPNLPVFAQHAQDAALNGHVRCRNVDRVHFEIGRLQADYVALGVKAFERRFVSVHESHDDFALAGCSCPFDENVVAVDDVLVAHGVSTHLEGEDIAVADDVVQRDGFGRLDCFDRQTGGNSASEGKLETGAGAGPWRQQVDGSAAVVHAVEHALLFKIGDVLVNGGQALETHAPRNLLKRRRVAVSGYKRLKEIDNLFLSSCDCHAGIIANKKRSARDVFSSWGYFLSTFGKSNPDWRLRRDREREMVESENR